MLPRCSVSQYYLRKVDDYTAEAAYLSALLNNLASVEAKLSKDVKDIIERCLFCVACSKFPV